MPSGVRKPLHCELSFCSLPNGHAPLLALLSPQQSNIRRHRTWSFAHSCQDACVALVSWVKASSPRAKIKGRNSRFQRNGNRSSVSRNGRLGGLRCSGWFWLWR